MNGEVFHAFLRGYKVVPGKQMKDDYQESKIVVTLEMHTTPKLAKFFAVLQLNDEILNATLEPKQQKMFEDERLREQFEEEGVDEDTSQAIFS
jgi:hypothetical protein